MQVPKGVTASLIWQYFLPGDVLEDVFSKEPWAVTALVKIQI